jgi:hypothetical protein
MLQINLSQILPFGSDLLAVLYISLIALGLYGINRLISYILKKIKRISTEQKNKVGFVLRAISIILIAFLIIEGFPSFEDIPDEYTSIIISSLSVAIAFVTSEIFGNIMAGFLLFIVDPFDVGHVVKIKDKKGVIRSVTLTKVVLETFNNIFVELTNNDVVQSTIVNYTLDLEDIDNYFQFKKQIQTPQDKGRARLDLDIKKEREDFDKQMKDLYENITENDYEFVHFYTFVMHIPYERFRIKIHQCYQLCDKYKEKFGFRPRFHIVGFGYDIDVKFRIISLESKKIMSFQPPFAQELYEIILSKE